MSLSNDELLFLFTQLSGSCYNMDYYSSGIGFLLYDITILAWHNW